MASPLRGDSPIRGSSPIPEGKKPEKIESEDRKRVKEASEVLKGREAPTGRKAPTRKARELKGFDKTLKTDTSPEKAAELAKGAETLKAAGEKVKKPVGGVSMLGGGGHDDALKAAMARRAEERAIKEKTPPKKEAAGSEERVIRKGVPDEPKKMDKKGRDTSPSSQENLFKGTKIPIERHADELPGISETEYNPMKTERDRAESLKKPAFRNETEKGAFEHVFGRIGGPVEPAGIASPKAPTKRGKDVIDDFKGKVQERDGKKTKEPDSDDDWVIIEKDKK